MQRRNVLVCLLALWVFFYRNKLKQFVAFIRHLQHGAKLVRALPGPGKEYERGVFGHMSGPLMLKPGEKFTPELVVEHAVERFSAVSRMYRGKGLFRMYAMNSSLPLSVLAMIMPTDINVVKEILSHKSMEDFNKGFAYKVSHPLIGDSVLSTSRAEWAVQRPVVERGFAHDIVGKSVPKIVQTVNELADKWEAKAKAKRNEATQDVREDMLRLTMDVIGRAAFGYDFRSTTSEEAPLYEPFVTILYTLERRSNYIHEHLTRNWSFLPWNYEFDRAIGKLNREVDEIIAKRTSEPAEDKAKRHSDFLDMLLLNNDMPEKLVKENIKTLLFAGHDTTGAALAWLFYLLARHPEAQRKARAEVLQRFGKRGDPTYEELEQVHFLNACLLETLRLYPSAGFMRHVRHEVEIGGHRLPPHCEILFLPYILHRDERYWGEQANEFMPERFLHMGFEAANNAGMSPEAAFRMDSLQSRIARIAKDHVYFPFSLGPRNCVGRPLALAEMRVVAIKLLQRFSFRNVEDEAFKEIPLLTLTLNPKSIKLTPVLMDDEI